MLAFDDPANQAAVTAVGGISTLQRLMQCSQTKEAVEHVVGMLSWLERHAAEEKAAAAAAQLLAEEERQATQQVARTAAKTARRQRQKERRRTAAAVSATAGSSAAPDTYPPATRTPAATVAVGAAGEASSSERVRPAEQLADQAALEAAGTSEPEAVAADPEEANDSNVDDELAQLMQEMEVSVAAAGAWGSAGPAASAGPPEAAGPVPNMPATPPRAQHPSASAGDTDVISSAGSGVFVEALADALAGNLRCPITHEPMRYPVLVADGHTFERQRNRDLD